MTSAAAVNAVPRTPALERLARCLERTGSYRILRRLEPRVVARLPEIPGTRLALYLDVETTGLDHAVDEVIELAVVPLRYTASGDVAAVGAPVTQFRQPSRPIPPQVTALTGIDDDLVAGHAIDDGVLAPMLAQHPLVIAHNAGFDRGFVEALIPAFVDCPWACSMREVPWREEGAAALALSVLAADAGFYYDAHRAADDCLAGIELLRRPLPRSGRVAFAEMLRSARRDTYDVMAIDTPYEARSILKARGYRWSPAGDGRPKCWFRIVDAEGLQPERAWLREVVYQEGVEVPAARVTAWTRYSRRAALAPRRC